MPRRFLRRLVTYFLRPQPLLERNIIDRPRALRLSWTESVQHTLTVIMARVHRVALTATILAVAYFLTFFNFLSVPLLDGGIAEQLLPVVRTTTYYLLNLSFSILIHSNETVVTLVASCFIRLVLFMVHWYGFSDTKRVSRSLQRTTWGEFCFAWFSPTLFCLLAFLATPHLSPDAMSEAYLQSKPPLCKASLVVGRTFMGMLNRRNATISSASISFRMIDSTLISGAIVTYPFSFQAISKKFLSYFSS